MASEGSERGNWDQVDALLERIEDADPSERTAVLEAVCAEHPDLRQELESLAAHLEPGAALFDTLSGALSGREPEGHPFEDPRGAPVRVDRYELVRKLASGMCLVYEARDLDSGHTVVLKMARPGADPTTRERLIREAHADLDLDHPNICRVLDFGVHGDGRPFLVLEHYAGQTLAERLQEAPLPPDRALRLGVQAAEGLAFAHSKGLIHRDIKPSNIMLVEDGSTRLLDFGIAKFGTSAFTASGLVLGTLVYMSPEQLRNQPVGPATDIWSLGLVLYEALTGTHPFRATSQRTTLRRMLRDPVEPVSSRVAGVSPAVDQVIASALSHDADHRPSASGFSASLSAVGG